MEIRVYIYILYIRQGCLLSSSLLEFVTVDLKSLCKEFKLNTKCDIMYADGTTLMSTAFEKLQLSTEELKVEHRLLQMQCLHFITQTYSAGFGMICHIFLTGLSRPDYMAHILPTASHGAVGWTLRSSRHRKLRWFVHVCQEKTLLDKQDFIGH